MIKASSRIVRETTAKFEYNDENGKLQSQDIRVLYYSLTVKELKANEAKQEKRWKALKKDERATVWLSEILAGVLHSLPDLCDDDEKPLKITEAALEEMDSKNLERISDAIKEDIAGKSQPSK